MHCSKSSGSQNAVPHTSWETSSCGQGACSTDRRDREGSGESEGRSRDLEAQQNRWSDEDQTGSAVSGASSPAGVGGCVEAVGVLRCWGLQSTRSVSREVLVPPALRALPVTLWAHARSCVTVIHRGTSRAGGAGRDGRDQVPASPRPSPYPVRRLRRRHCRPAVRQTPGGLRGAPAPHPPSETCSPATHGRPGCPSLSLGVWERVGRWPGRGKEAGVASAVPTPPLPPTRFCRFWSECLTVWMSCPVNQ